MKNGNISKFANVLAQVNLEDIYLRQVFEYYMTCYTASGWAQAYVQKELTGQPQRFLISNAVF